MNKPFNHTTTKDCKRASAWQSFVAPILGHEALAVTANALVDYWCTRLLGYLPTAERRQTLAKFMAQNGDPASYRIEDSDAWAANDLKKHYNHQRLRSMVTLILLSPEFMSR